MFITFANNHCILIGFQQLYSGEEHVVTYTPAVYSKKIGRPPVEFAKLLMSPRVSALKELRHLVVLSLLIILKARRFGGFVRTTLLVSADVASGSSESSKNTIVS